MGRASPDDGAVMSESIVERVAAIIFRECRNSHIAGQEHAEQIAREIIAALREQDLEESIHIELTASSASINKDADRQNAVMLTNLLGQYYEKVLTLVGIASNPQTPEAVRKVAIDIATKAGEIIDRTVRTFDSIRDPATFVIEIEDVVNSAQGAQQGAVQQLMAMLMQAGQQGNGGAVPQPEGGGGEPPVQ